MELKELDSKTGSISTRKKFSLKSLSLNELKNWFNNISIQTNNFTKLDPNILFEDPKNILIFRLFFKLSFRDLEKLLGKNSNWNIRKWQSGERRMKKESAEKVMRVFENSRDKIKEDVTFEDIEARFGHAKGLIRKASVEKSIISGLLLAQNSEITPSEKQIVNILKQNGINSFELHAIVDGFKKPMNVDFAFPSNKNLKIVLETLSINNKPRRINNNLKLRSCKVDHKFQSLKLRNKNVKTIIHIQFKGRPVLKEQIKKSLDLELLNTDYILINDEIKNLPSVIRSINTSNNISNLGIAF